MKLKKFSITRKTVWTHLTHKLCESELYCAYLTHNYLIFLKKSILIFEPEK